MARYCFVAMVVGMTLAQAADAQTVLRLRLVEGADYRRTESSRLEQSMVLAGMQTLETTAEQTTVTRVRVGQYDTAGRLPVDHQIERVQARLNLPPGIEVSYDSTKPRPTEVGPLPFYIDAFAAMQGARWQVVYDQQQDAVEVRNIQPPLESLNDQVRAVLGGQFGEEQRLAEANQVMETLPAEPVRPGESWERTRDLELGGGQQLRLTFEYTYEGPRLVDGRTLERVAAKLTSATLAITDEDSPVKLLRSQLRIDESDGFLHFDPQRSWVVQSEYELAIRGDLQMALGEMEVAAQLEIRIEDRSLVE